MRPISFAGTTGYWHDAPGDCLVVLAGAVGYEQLCIQRTWRELADRIAAAGYPVMRFDWAGCGDALGSDADPGRCDAWEGSLHAALAFARDRAGARRIVIVSMRLGALIAARVAAEDRNVEALALLAPPANGRSHARELAALATVIGTRRAPQGSSPLAAGDFELAGFLVTAQTRSDLERYDPRKLETRPAHNVLLVAQAGQTNAEALAAHLRRLGAEVQSGVFTGYHDLMVEPTLSKTPDAAIEDVLAWLRQTVPLVLAARPLTPPTAQRLVGQGFVEESTILPSEGPIAAVWCRPVHAGRNEAVLFVNAGSNPRMGWARMNVEFARALAQDGITSMRMDVAGLGDSPPVAGRRSQVMYDDAPRRDVGSAVDALLAEGFSRITIVGLCSGAHLAFHTALEHPGVTGFVLVNLQRFIWRSTDRFEIVVRDAYRSNEHYKAALWRRDTWTRLVRGEINVRGIARTVSKRLLRISKNRTVAAARHLGLVDDDTAKVQRWFRRLAERDVRGHVIYSAEDGGLDELYLHMGAQARDLLRLPGMSLTLIDGADHNVSPSWARSLLVTHLRGFLAAPAQSRPEPIRDAAQ
jgi:predicted alpha/beta hydrolase